MTGGCRVPATVADDQPHTRSTHVVRPPGAEPGFANGFQSAHREFFPPTALAVGRAHVLVAVGPSSAPSDRLRRALAQPATQVQL
jgi:hypothetical protein